MEQLFKRMQPLYLRAEVEFGDDHVSERVGSGEDASLTIQFGLGGTDVLPNILYKLRNRPLILPLHF